MSNQSNQNSNPKGVSRRDVLRGSSAAAAATVLGTKVWARPTDDVGRYGTAATRDVFVQIFLRGAMDGMSTVIPYREAEYYNARPSLAIAPPGLPGGAIDLDGFFGLNPAASSLMTPYAAGHLAFVHASGSTDPTRSHFEAVTKMELGEPNLPTGTALEGWLARYLNQLSDSSNGVLRAIGANDVLPRTLRGAPDTLPIPDLGNFQFPGNPQSAQERANLLAGLYAPKPAPVGPTALDTFAAIDLIGQVDFAGYIPAGGASYPSSSFGQKMQNFAAIIKAGLGVEAIAVEYNGWDHHANQDPRGGLMANMLADLTASMEAFYIDMLAMINGVTLVCMSEFGRRLAENSSLGTDHGHGNVMMLLGGGINGGQVFANWPGLQPAQLDSGDLAVTIDYRDILGEILSKRLGATNLSVIFEQHSFVSYGVAH